MVSKQILAVGLIALVIGLSVGYSAPFVIPPLQPSKPTITLSATTVKTGEQYTATLSGFSSNTEIYGWVVNENPPRSFLAGTTDGNGNLVLSSYAPQTPGQWLLTASDKAQTSWANTLMTVQA
jgi:hypothetical protein